MKIENLSNVNGKFNEIFLNPNHLTTILPEKISHKETTNSNHQLTTHTKNSEKTRKSASFTIVPKINSEHFLNNTSSSLKRVTSLQSNSKQSYIELKSRRSNVNKTRRFNQVLSKKNSIFSISNGAESNPNIAERSVSVLTIDQNKNGYLIASEKDNWIYFLVILTLFAICSAVVVTLCYLNLKK